MGKRLQSPFVLEYRYKRSTGPVVGRFLQGLLEARVEGVRTRSGRVLVPPREYDPENGDPLPEDPWVEVGQEGTVSSWTEGWALVRLDGADTSLLHRALEPVRTGDRVRICWAEDRRGHITDIEGFRAL